MEYDYLSGLCEDFWMTRLSCSLCVWGSEITFRNVSLSATALTPLGCL